MKINFTEWFLKSVRNRGLTSTSLCALFDLTTVETKLILCFIFKKPVSYLLIRRNYV